MQHNLITLYEYVILHTKEALVLPAIYLRTAENEAKNYLKSLDLYNTLGSVWIQKLFKYPYSIRYQNSFKSIIL